MPDGFKIADAYVDVVAKVDERSLGKSAKDAGDRAGSEMGRRASKGIGDHLRKDRGILASAGIMGLTAGPALVGGIGKGLMGLGGMLSSNPYVLGAGAIIAGVAAPGIAAALAGAITAGVGAGVIGIGAVLLKNDPLLKGAGTQLKNHLLDIDTTELEANYKAAQERMSTASTKEGKKRAKAELDAAKKALDEANAYNAKNFSLRDAAKPLLKPLVEAMKVFGDMATRIMPTVEKMFAALGPAVVPLAEGLASLVENMLPGLLEMMEAAGPLLTNLAPIFGLLGQQMSVFFSTLAGSSGEGLVALQDLLVFTGFVIIGVANLISTLAGMYMSVRGFFLGIPGWIAGAKAAVVGWVTAVGTGVTNIIAWFADLPGRVGAFLAALPGRVMHWISQTMQQAAFAVGFGIGSVVAFFRDLPSRASSAISGLWGALVGHFNSAKSGAASSANALVSGAVNVIRGLPGKAASALSSMRSAVTGAFSGAGSWLVSAGANILRGLISGINSMIGAAVSAARNAVGSVVSGAKSALGINSPSKVMRDQVGRWMLPGLTEGVARSVPKAQGVVSGAVRSLGPAVSAGGLRTGSAAGGTSIHIGTVTLDASGMRSMQDVIDLIAGIESGARSYRARTATVGGY